MSGYRLSSFVRDVTIDSKLMREELDAVLKAVTGKKSTLSETTFTGWRTNAGGISGVHNVTQVQAVLIVWQALYGISGKKSMRRHDGKSKPLTKIKITDYRRYCDRWLADGDIPVQGVRLLSWIHGVGVTPGQLAAFSAGQSAVGKFRTRGLSLRSLQRAAQKESVSLPRSRPLSQRFMRKLVQKTVLKPVKQTQDA